MKTIGRYIIEGLLGQGGMGKVYKVKVPTIQKIAALKLLDPDPLVAQLMGMDKLLDLFTHEAVTMAGLSHPNIVAVHDFDDHGGKPYFVMDYYPNNLGTIMGEYYIVERPSRRLSVDRSLDYALQTLEGLGCLHDADIVHRDIKPFNLLVTAQDTIKICDFGLSKLRREAFKGPANLNVGSPYYAAPEQEKTPDKVDTRADLYSIGIMLYRMLTGRLPCLSDADRQFPSPGQINQDLDTRWDDFFTQAVARRPEDRFADAGDMKKALVNLQKHWQAHKEKSCARPDLWQDPPQKEPRSTAQRVRRKACRIRPSQAVNRFHLDDLWQPKTYTANQFVREDDKTVRDKVTNLIWQKSGSPYPRTWPQACAYISQLNDTAYGGIKNWRLPTIDELLTILQPSAQGAALCIAPLFDQKQRWIWSADRRSFIAAYYADAELGFVGWQDFSAPYYVRAVCGP